MLTGVVHLTHLHKLFLLCVTSPLCYFPDLEIQKEEEVFFTHQLSVNRANRFLCNRKYCYSEEGMGRVRSGRAEEQGLCGRNSSRRSWLGPTEWSCPTSLSTQAWAAGAGRHLGLGFQLPWTVKNPPAVQEAWVPGREAPLEKGMATPSSILAWRVQWTDEMKAAVRGVAMSRTQLGN